MNSSNNDDGDILAAACAGFIEEARDNLVQFEQALLSMESDPQDAEAVNTAFRAAHTIKGGAGLFGYDAVVGFTHEVESLMEAMRSGDVDVTEAVMGVLLRARDQMGRLVDEIGAPQADAELARAGAELSGQLRALRAAGPSAPDGVAPAALADAVPQQAATWHISLRMGGDALRNGLDPASFIRYLDTLGTVRIRTCASRVPELAMLDAESCHLGFEIRLATASDRAGIEQVFEFLRDDCDLAVIEPGAASEQYEALLARRALDEGSRQEMLALWQELAGPHAPPFIERRAERVERREASTSRRAGDDLRFIRVRADKLDQLIDLIGELVIASSGAQLVAKLEESPRFAEAALRIHDLVQSARDGALGLRMVPIGDIFSRFQRVVRDVCKQLDKEVELVITGGETELDKSMVETISDPLMHLVRNSLDHGIEGPQARLAAGKPAQGRLSLNAYHESGSVVIEVTDDGRGLDKARILAKAIEQGLVPPDAGLDDDAIHQLIFAPGFSTAAALSNLSGRGVGMDVVKRNIESLRGQIRIASQPGRGTTMLIRLPLTLAIIDGFLTSVGDVGYVLPLDLVSECIELPRDVAGHDPGQVTGYCDLRGEVLPYLDVGRFFKQSNGTSQRRSMVVVKDGATRVGLVVDRLLGEHQTVIKPLGRVFQDIRGLSGSTILGSGDVALILDVPALLQLAVDRLTTLQKDGAPGRCTP
jgi:two-component system chemotaxis sensor kinase CheA